MSNSVRPHRQQPTRLPRPWDSPGKNTGVGCHFLLQCMKLKSESEVAQSCPTLSDLMDCSLTGSSVHEIFQARVLEWGAIAFSEIYRSHGEIQYLYHSHSVTTIKCVFDSFLNFCFQRTIIQYSDFPKNNKVQIFFNAVYHSPRHHNIVMYLHHYFSRGRF